MTNIHILNNMHILQEISDVFVTFLKKNQKIQISKLLFFFLLFHLFFNMLIFSNFNISEIRMGSLIAFFSGAYLWCILNLMVLFSVKCSYWFIVLWGYVLPAQSCPTLGCPTTIAHQASLSMRFSRQEY